jgi:hypothetical protein
MAWRMPIRDEEPAMQPDPTVGRVTPHCCRCHPHFGQPTSHRPGRAYTARTGDAPSGSETSAMLLCPGPRDHAIAAKLLQVVGRNEAFGIREIAVDFDEADLF